MSSIRLYADEDAAESAVVAGLRGRGIDVLTTLEAGLLGSGDDEQLEFATQQGRAVYTFNVGDVAAFITSISSSRKSTRESSSSLNSDIPSARKFTASPHW